MFSKRFKSSSNIDFLAKTDLTISDGFTSFTSKSKNLCLLEKLVELGFAGGSMNACVRVVLPPFHFSNISSSVRMRSSIDGLFVDVISESLEFELIEGVLFGLIG